MMVMQNEIDYRKERFSKDNTGYTNLPSCVTRCLFVSGAAKTLYTALIQYAYGDKKNSYPSQAKLAQDLQTTPKRIGKYSEELEDSGLIKRVLQIVSYKYFFPDVNSIPVIVHSEIVWKILDVVKGYGVKYEKFYKVIKAYKKSTLYENVSRSSIPEEFEGDIQEYFFKELGVKTENDDWADDHKPIIIRFAIEDQFRPKCLDYLYKKYLEVHGEKLDSNTVDDQYIEFVFACTFIPPEERIYCIFDSDLCKRKMAIVNKTIDDYFSNSTKEECTVKKFAEHYIKAVLGEHEFIRYINNV